MYFQDLKPCQNRASLSDGDSLEAGEAVVDGREDVADDRAEQHQNSNNNDGDQNENQRVFDQALTFFLGSEQHVCISPFFRICPS